METWSASFFQNHKSPAHFPILRPEEKCNRMPKSKIRHWKETGWHNFGIFNILKTQILQNGVAWLQLSIVVLNLRLQWGPKFPLLNKGILSPEFTTHFWQVIKWIMQLLREFGFPHWLGKSQTVILWTWDAATVINIYRLPSAQILIMWPRGCCDSFKCEDQL